MTVVGWKIRIFPRYWNTRLESTTLRSVKFSVETKALEKPPQRGGLHDIRGYSMEKIKNTVEVELNDDFDDFQFKLNYNQLWAVFETMVLEICCSFTSSKKNQ